LPLCRTSRRHDARHGQQTFFHVDSSLFEASPSSFDRDVGTVFHPDQGIVKTRGEFADVVLSPTPRDVDVTCAHEKSGLAGRFSSCRHASLNLKR
jgi:hypothetical protein